MPSLPNNKPILDPHFQRASADQKNDRAGYYGAYNYLRTNMALLICANFDSNLDFLSLFFDSHNTMSVDSAPSWYIRFNAGVRTIDSEERSGL
jgi:hypothetical protein